MGYGLEARIPDYTAARILEGAIPYLRRHAYQGAIEAVVRGVVNEDANFYSKVMGGWSAGVPSAAMESAAHPGWFVRSIQSKLSSCMVRP